MKWTMVRVRPMKSPAYLSMPFLAVAARATRTKTKVRTTSIRMEYATSSWTRWLDPTLVRSSRAQSFIPMANRATTKAPMMAPMTWKMK